MAKVKMTPKEYADKRGITIQAVHKAIKLKHTLPSVAKVENFGRFYVLTVSVNEKGALS